MNSRLFVELFGYLGSVLVVVSMLMCSVVRLRVINTTGSIISAIYALIIGSYPLALMNISLIVINLYHLFRLHNPNRHYELLECPASDGYLQFLMRYYRKDIAKYFPAFSPDQIADDSRIFAVCLGREVAGMLIGRPTGTDLEISLDYTTPVYRDCSVGSFLYGKLAEIGISKLVCNTPSKEHQNYLSMMGFQPDGVRFCRISD